MDKLLEQMFDFEVFPNWWCCVIGKYPQDDKADESIKDDFTVITSDSVTAREDLLNIMCDKNYVNMGYNIKHYDNIILNGVANGFTPHQLRILSDLIINPDLQYSTVEHSRIAPFARKGYRNFVYQDMLDDNVGSLKDKETCMQLDIRESTVPFDKPDLTSAEKEDIISYCKHDVWASMQFYKVVLKPFIATKLLVGRVFDIPMDVCYKSTNANLSARALNAEKRSYTDTDRKDVVIPDGLKNYINYSLPQNIVKRLCASPEKFDVNLFGNIVSYSNGGIHSVPCKNVIVESNDEWALVNADGASFYPATMITWKTLSRAVKHPEKFEEMYKARLEFKKVIEPFEEKYGKNVHLAPKEEYEHYHHCKETSQAYKLILNTTYGASGNKYLPLYDPYMTTVTCRLGQLILTSLANNIYNQIGAENVSIIQTNTDGVLVYIKRDKLPMLHAIGDEFTKVTHIMLEYEEEKKIWQRDVNNYIMLKHSGREKSKGGFFVTDMIQPGYNRVRPLDCYVCRDAVKGWLMNGEDIVEHIYGEKDLSKFVVTCNKGSFSGIQRQFNDGRPNEVLHKCNRVYASLNKDLGIIVKTKKFKGEMRTYKCPGCPPHCELINEALDKYNINDIRKDLDYMWYVEATIDLLSDQWYELQGNKIVPIKIFD